MKNETAASEKSKILMRTYITSLLSLMLCVTMLLGTTYAWFTSEVTTAGNEIYVGMLKVGMTDAAGNDLAGAKALFGNTAEKAFRWEPGATQVETVKIVNHGDLAFHYGLYLSTVEADSAVEREALELIGKYIDVYVLTGTTYTTTEFVESEWTNLGSLTEVVKSGGMLTGGKYDAAVSATDKSGTETNDLVATITIAMHMREETSDPGIMGKSIKNVGLKLIASQLDAERDSFGGGYDKEAVYADATYVAENQASLASVLADINKAQDENVLIWLNKPVQWETGAAHGSTPWVTEGAAVSNLMIDGNGNTITATGAGVGPIRMANGGTLTIKNAKIVDKSESYAEDSWEFGYLEFDGKLVFENCEFVNSIMMEGENVKFIDCSFNSNADSEYAVWVANGNAVFENCTFAGPRGLKTHEAYGTKVGTITVDNCTFDNITKKPGVAIGTVDANTTITIKNSDFINCQPGDQNLYIYETDTDVTTFKFDISQNNEVIKSVTPDLTITTAEQMFAFANDVNVNGNNYAGKLVVLGADIDLNNAEWTPVGQTGGNGVATYFQGMFDGKGHTISNLKVTDNAYDEGANYAAGLFGFVDAGDAQIVNLNIVNAEVNGHHWTGVVAGYITGKISGCTVTNAAVSCTHANNEACGDKAGVITGYVNGGVVTGNTAKDCTVTAGRDAGQVSGTSKTEYTYGNTVYNVTVTATGDCTGANIRNEEIGRVN